LTSGIGGAAPLQVWPGNRVEPGVVVERGMVRTASLVVVLLGAACGADSVGDHVEALRAGDARYVHSTFPSPERLAELYPETRKKAAGSRHELRGNEHAAAILDAGEAAVPDLVALLDDPESRTLAAFFLGEIGGERAASALLGRWRALRGKAVRKRVYVFEPRRERLVRMARGYRYEGVDHEFYGEVLGALRYAGRAVSASIAADTAAAMDKGERLHANGEALRYEQRRREGEQDLELRWSVEPVETACEGLETLAMVGALEAPDLFVRALRGPIRAFRWTAMQQVGFLGKDAQRTLPALGALLDDPDWRKRAVKTLAEALDGEHWLAPLSDERAQELADRFKVRLRARGHLPR